MTPSPLTTEVDTSSWLSKELIQKVLQDGEDDQSLTVEELEVRDAVAKGDNYGSSLHRVIATLRDNRGSRRTCSLVVKTLPQLQMMQRFAKELLLFEKEMYAYSSLLPAMRSLAEVPLESPRFYPTDRPGTIVLEDISARGFKMADRREGLDLEHCILALRTLAKFHGLSVELVRADPAVVGHFEERIHAQWRRETHKSYVPNIYRNLADIVETWRGFERFGEKIRRCEETVIEELEELMKPEDNGFNVVNHGDFWVNNMMFRYSDETQRVEEVCLVDFQLLRFSSPALDLQYFFATSPTAAVREEHEDLLLQTYHEALMETIRRFGLDSQVYSLDQLKKDFKDKMMYGFHVACTISCVVVAEPADAMELDSVSDESIEAKDVNYLTKALQGKKFKEIFQKLLISYEQKSLFYSHQN